MMKILYKIGLFSFFLLFPVMLNAQVLISLVFGEALNSDKIEFGLSGGMNRSYINTISTAKGMNNFDLGFYFHILMKNNSYLSTGVHVKSNVGATGMPTYPLGDEDFDSLYQDGTLTKKIPVFYVPILFHQRFNNRWYIEAGPQLGLIYRSEDIFETSELDGELTYTRNVQDEYKRIDAGFLVGAGYKLKQEIKSMAVGVNYYFGLVDVSKTADVSVKNSSIYFYVKIPIGAGKSEKNTQN
jgi:hypothetical protein